MAENQPTSTKVEPWDNLKKIKAFSQQPNALLDKQQITEEASLMYPVYEHALSALHNVMASSSKWVEESVKSHNKDFYGYGNNVIAFCAPRGQGKTSAMLSLSYALEHCDDVIMNGYSYPLNSDEDRYGRKRASRCFVKEQGTLWEKTIENKHFLVMPPIDPTVLDGKESVVSLVLAWLFQEINEAWKKCQDSPERIEKEKHALLKHFQKCKECLARHNSTEDSDFSDLIKKSVIFEIKEHLYEIIDCYFQVCGVSKPDIEHYLIIQLDDTDMDMVNAYNVLEDVRKFLSLPKTIVLMATYLRQLRMLVAKHYEDVLSLPKGSKSDSQHPIDYMQMAAKYIDKLIPAQQMIHIGSFRNQHDLNGKVSIESFLKSYTDETEKKKSDIDKDSSGKELEIDDDLEEAFFALIKAKTGLIFEKHSTYVNNILPTTLRGLVHLFQLLDKMGKPEWNNIDGFHSYYDDLKLRQRNLVSFEDYFRNDWCYSNLVEEDQEIMWKISQAHVTPKLRIIQNLLVKRWEWSDEWMRNRIKSNLPSDLKNSSIIISPNSKWTKTQEAEKIISSIVGSPLPMNQELYKNVSIQFEFKTQKNIYSELAVVCYFDIFCLLSEAIRRAESMNDLLLVFAIRTHLSIQLHKLFLSDELENIGEVIHKPAEKTELEKGVFRYRDHPRVRSFLGVKNIPETEELDERIERIRASLDSLEPDKYSMKDRYEDFGILFSCGDYFKRSQAPAGKVYAVEDKAFIRQGFILQNAVFQVLANHEVLRMWLSEEPERFIRCEKYIWEDNSASVKIALDAVHRGKTAFNDLPTPESNDSNTAKGTERPPYDPHQD